MLRNSRQVTNKVKMNNNLSETAKQMVSHVYDMEQMSMTNKHELGYVRMLPIQSLYNIIIPDKIRNVIVLENIPLFFSYEVMKIERSQRNRINHDFRALFKVISATKYSNDIRKCCKFIHTCKLESFHSMKLTYLPKSTGFTSLIS